MDRGNLYNTRHVFYRIFSRGSHEERKRRRLENPQERNNGRLFVNYFLRAEGGRGEGTGIKKKAKIGV